MTSSNTPPLAGAEATSRTPASGNELQPTTEIDAAALEARRSAVPSVCVLPNWADQGPWLWVWAAGPALTEQDRLVAAGGGTYSPESGRALAEAIRLERTLRDPFLKAAARNGFDDAVAGLRSDLAEFAAVVVLGRPQ